MKISLFLLFVGLFTKSATGETAFAKQCQDEICFLGIAGLEGNRWGWANKGVAGVDGIYLQTLPMYAGAGQCDLSKGYYVGNVDIDYSGGNLTVTSTVFPGFSMNDVHIHVDGPEDDKKVPSDGNGKLTVAPGLYRCGTHITGADPTDPFPCAVIQNSPAVFEATFTNVPAIFYVIVHAAVDGSFNNKADGQECVSAAPTPAASNACHSPNLGDDFSGPTGIDAYSQNWPKLQHPLSGGIPIGRDDSVAFFVGRNYYGKAGAEIEGKMVIVGNLVNDDINSMVQVGLGSQIIPNNGQDVITVGGDFETKTNIAIMQNSPSVSGNIVYKGSLVIKNGAKIWTNGQVTQKSNLDLSGYNKALDELKVKSAYWAELPVNGVYTLTGATAVFKAGNDDCVQVFNLTQSEFADLPWGIHVEFDANLKDRTVLINYGSDNNKNVKITNLANFFDPSGKGHMDFDSGFTASILWNFYDANYVDLGGGSSGVGEFQGSILVPNGSLMMQFPGQSGRTIVGLDLTQNRGGSEFHSYPFNPPKCNLPLPPCAPSTSPSMQPSSSTSPSEGNRPTDPPTVAPEPVTCIGRGSTEGIILNHQLGKYSTTEVDYDDMPISILSQNNGTVTFEVKNDWGDNHLDHIFVEYLAPEGFPRFECLVENNVAPGQCVKHTAKCMRGNSVAVVTITAVDRDILVTADTPDVPRACCAANGIDLTEKSVVKYVFELQCLPTNCDAPVINTECLAPQQQFVEGVLLFPLKLNGANKQGDTSPPCRFNEECESCCCNTQGQEGAATACSEANESNCCSYATYISTYPYGTACP